MAGVMRCLIQHPGQRGARYAEVPGALGDRPTHRLDVVAKPPAGVRWILHACLGDAAQRWRIPLSPSTVQGGIVHQG